MITFSYRYLRQALSGLRVLKVSKHKLPALQSVLIGGRGDTVTFAATTLDEHLVFEARGESDGATQLVPFDLLADALKSADTNSAFTLSPGTLRCTAGGSDLSLPLPDLKPEDFPGAPVASGNSIALPAGVLGRMVEAQGCASTQATRYLLNSVFLSPHEVVATDGRQMYVSNGLDLPIPGGGLLFPSSGVPEVLHGDQPAELWAWDLELTPKACVAQGPWRWTTKLVVGNYPNYRQVIPKEESYASTVTIAESDATRLMAVLPRLPGFKESSSPVVLTICQHGVSLSPPPRLPQVKVALDHSAVTGLRPNLVQFNAEFLLAALKRGFRELRVKDAFSPVVMRDASRTNLWMPIQLPSAPSASVPEALPEPVRINPQPNTEPEPVTPMVAINSTPTAEPTTAARIPAPVDVPSEVSPIDTLQRAKDLLRELQTALSDASVAVRDMAREKRNIERDLDSLKRNVRALKALEV